MKLPYGQGIWPAFWMLGENFNQAGWPGAGEIDILENIGKEPDTIHATVHAPGYYGGKEGTTTSFVVPAGTLKDDFHVYAIEWQENEIRWLFDEQEYFKLTPADVPGEWIFDHPFFIIMNVAVGGRWPEGSPRGAPRCGDTCPWNRKPCSSTVASLAAPSSKKSS